MRRVLLSLLLVGCCFGLKAQVNTDGVIRIGQNALYYEDYALAIQYFNQVIAAKPYLYTPYFYRAVAKYYLGDYQGAVNDCTASIERDPYISEVYRLRAINYIRIDNFEAASADYSTLINERQDKSRDVWYNQVLCQTQLKRLEDADALLDTMIVRWPDYARCYLLKAQIAVNRADTIVGDSLLNKALALDSSDVDAYSAKAMLCLQRQMYAEAERNYDKAVALAPKHGGLYINRALARYQQHDLRGAMDDYNAALELMPNNYLGHYNRALLRMQVGENNLAIEDFDFVLSKRADDRLALYNRAILRQQTGDYRRAITDYTTVLQDYPNFAGAYVNRAYCYKRIGDVRRSEADDRKAMDIRLNEVLRDKAYSSPLDSVTRQADEADIEDYDKLVADNEENIVPFYSSEYRGRVQNREVAVEHQPLYALTFAQADNGLYHSAALSKATFLDSLNASGLLHARLCLSPKENPMSEADYRVLQAKREEVAERLAAHFADADSTLVPAQDTKEHFVLLFIHALYTSCERDYEAAVQDLNQCIDHSANSVEAYLLRAVARVKLMEVAADAAADKRVREAAVIADLTAAIEIEPDCAYLYYNRGCVHSLAKEYAKAESDYTRALELNPSLAEAYYNRGLDRVASGDKQGGIADLSKAGELGLFTAYSLIKQLR